MSWFKKSGKSWDDNYREALRDKWIKDATYKRTFPPSVPPSPPKMPWLPDDVSYNEDPEPEKPDSIRDEMLTLLTKIRDLYLQADDPQEALDEIDRIAAEGIAALEGNASVVVVDEATATSMSSADFKAFKEQIMKHRFQSP